MPSSRWWIPVLSFVAMFVASAVVLHGRIPAGGLPLLPFAAHAAALASVIVEVLSRAFKLQVTAAAISLRLPFVTALRVCLAGDFAAAITPGRAGAEPARFLVLGECDMPSAGRVMILSLELVLETLSLVAVCALMVFALQGHGASITGLLVLSALYCCTVVGIGLAAAWLSARFSHGPPPRWAQRVGLRHARWRAMQLAARQLRSAYLALRDGDAWRMVLAFLGSVVHVLCRVATLPLLVYLSDDTFPRTLDTLAPLALWPLAIFYGGVVVPVPGGGGVVEGAFAATLTSAIPTAIFAATLVWWRFYTFYVYVLVGGALSSSVAARAIQRRRARGIAAAALTG